MASLDAVEERIVERALLECEPARLIFVGPGLPQQLRSRLNGVHTFTNTPSDPADVAVVEVQTVSEDGTSTVDGSPTLHAKRIVGVSAASLREHAALFDRDDAPGLALDVLVTSCAVFGFYQSRAFVEEVLQGYSALRLNEATGKRLLAASTLKAFRSR